MTDRDKTRNLLKRLRFQSWFLVVLWSVCIAASLLWSLHEQGDKVLNIARNSAEVTFENDILYRSWVSKHGGVYVPVSEHTPPNPYLTVPDRDVTTTSGLSLTLVNPAYMTRQVHEMGAGIRGSRGHITSLNPIRPENRPDTWEAAALKSFAGGVTETSSVEMVEGEECLRLMRPFKIEQACLKCHAAQGYKEGDIRGGISVSLPLSPLWAIERPVTTRLSLAHLLLWLVGIGGIVISQRGLGRQVLAREKVGRVLRARVRLSELAQQGSAEVLAQTALDDAELLTGSSIGYLHLVGEDQKSLSPKAWSTTTLRSWGRAVGEGLDRPMSRSGIWADCLQARAPVIHNDHTRLHGQEGMPEGHPPVFRDLAVPVLRGGSVVAIMGVGNKATPYDQDDVGVLEEIASLTVDLQAYQQAEAALRQSEQRLELSLAAGGLAPWEIDIATEAVFSSPRLRRLLGAAEDAQLRTRDDLRAYVVPEDVPRIQQAIEAALAGSAKYRVEFRIRRPDGAIRWISSEADLLPDAQGRLVRLVGVAVDITDRKRAEEALEKARAEAESANKAKDEFLALLSHELRTPLTAILGWAKMMRRGRLDQSRQAYGLEVIERNTHAQAKLIEDLLDVSRVVTGKIVLERNDVELAHVVRSAVDSIRAAADVKGIHLTVDLIEEERTIVRGDQHRLQQIFTNLLANAVKFTPPDGAIRVRLERDCGQLAVSVSDTGIGIEPEFLPHMFQRFSQQDPSITRRFRGLGLGLALVRSLIEMHGGTVQVSSGGPGTGATFTVRLPVAAPGAAPAPRSGSDEEARADRPKGPDLSTIRVLVVEDEPDTRELLLLLLREFGLDVVAAASAAEAMACFRERRCDLLISDIGLPGEDGCALLERIRAERGADMPAIALTAYARPEERERIMDAGYGTHLTKPVSPEELVSAIQALVRSIQK